MLAGNACHLGLGRHLWLLPGVSYDGFRAGSASRRCLVGPIVTYFFCCSMLLAPGSVVEPGNWGRIIKLYKPSMNANAWALARELIFERVRLQNYAEKPSRFDALFLCFTELDLQEFRSMNSRPIDISYEVKLVDPEAASHTADWSTATTEQTDDFAAVERRAHTYWQAQNIRQRELVTLSPIKVVRRFCNETHL